MHSASSRVEKAGEPPTWAAEYVGLPWRTLGRARGDWRRHRADPAIAGVDCWGVIRLVLEEQFRIAVPAYDGLGYRDRADRAEVARLIAGERGPWQPVVSGEERAGDVALFRVMGHACHVGAVVVSGWMVHVEEGIDSCLERYDGLAWGRRFMGAYRWTG